MVISDKAMQALPSARDVWLIEGGPRGAGRLVGRITPTGARSFYYRYTASNGSRIRLLIGSYSPRGDAQAAFTVQQARDRARALTTLYRDGIRDLREYLRAAEEDRQRSERQARREAEERERQQSIDSQRALTVRKLFEQWQRVELAPRQLADGTRTGRKDGGAWVKASFDRRVFARIGDMQAAEVRRADLMSILDDCKAEGALRTTNVLFTDLRQMFRYAVEREIVATNPLEGLKRERIGGKDTERDRVLKDSELQQLWRAVPTARMSPSLDLSRVTYWMTPAGV